MNPVLVNDWRGNAIENHHRGAVAVADARGRLVMSLGDVQRPVFPRSSIKFLQALAFVESGAVEHYHLDDRHLALACASHNGESVHVDLVQDWLARIHCEDDDLECGAELPIHVPTQFELMTGGNAPLRVHHNCSGKHASLLSTCRHLGEQHRNYRLYSHPAQQRVFDVLANMTSARVPQLPWGYDGCGIPAVAMPLQRLAIGMARFADPSALGAERRSAVERLQNAIASQPYLVAGKERLCTALMERLAPQVLVKLGAEGMYTAALPEKGLGVAIKIDDGRGMPAQVVLGAILQKLGVMSAEMARELEEFIAPNLTNSRGETIGRVEPASAWNEISDSQQTSFADW